MEAKIQAVFDTIANQPDRYPTVYRDVRGAQVIRFPYVVYYRVKSDRIIVISVHHTSRDPAIWQSRV